jgi:hypothetical protein
MTCLPLGTRLPGRHNEWWRKKEVDMRPDLISDLPFSLLGEFGWDHLDPFIPIEVLPYTQGELDTMIDFHVDKKYIRDIAKSDLGREEIHFMTSRNPLQFMEMANFF